MKKFVAVSIAGAIAVGAALVGTQMVSGAGESAESVFVSITPCRLVDTRPNTATNPTINVGPRNTKLGPDGSQTFGACDGADGNSTCEIPASATAIATNATAVQPTAQSFMTLFPSDVPNPGTSNLNYVSGQAPTPNSVIVPLSADGKFDVFNKFGEVHVLVDVSGFYQPSSAVGATGPQGPAGPPGEDATNPAWIITVGESGADFTSVSAALASITDNGPTSPYLIEVAPGEYTETSSLVMKHNVGIRGAGSRLTQFICECSDGGGVLQFPSVTSSSVSDLTIIGVANGSGASAHGVVIGGASVRLDDVVVEVLANGENSSATGISIEGSPPTFNVLVELIGVSIDAFAGGIGSQEIGVRAGGTTSVTIQSSEINIVGNAAIGAAVDVSGPDNTVRINASSINSGNLLALSNNGDGAGPTERIVVTGGSVIGGVSPSSDGTLHCAAVFDGNFNERSPGCVASVMSPGHRDGDGV